MLKKNLGLLDVFCLAAGAMISSGLFVLPGIAFAHAGPAMILSYILASIFMIPTMFAKAELVTAMPKSGGDYFFVERSLGPLAGLYAGLLNWLSDALKTAFALVGIGAIGLQFFPEIGQWGLKSIAIAFGVLFTVINIVSVKSVGRLQVVLVFGLISILGLDIAAGIPKVSVTNYSPFFITDFKAVFAVAGMVFISYGGLTKVASVAEEVRKPSRNLPLGMFLAAFIISLIYIVVVFVTVGTVDPKILAGTLVPISESAKSTLGYWGMFLIDVASLLAFITTANAGVLSASRSPMAMSFDGLIPAVFGKMSSRFATPYVAILFTSGFIIAVIALLTIEELVKTASTMMLLLFVLVNVAIIIMRESRIQSYRPSFKSPFYPWLHIFAIILYGFLIVEMGSLPMLLTGGFGLVAGFWFIFYIWRRINRESAFVYLVKSITSKAIQRSGLEDELRQISLERGGVELDRFDHILTNALILDLKGRKTADELFHEMARVLSRRLNLEEAELYRKFIDRERESSTVIHPGLAIPHVIIDGQNHFDVLLVRCLEGVVFSELHPPVKTVFALIGTLDERNFHLRALMRIAHLVEHPEFEKRWLKAKGIEQLRDVVLLIRPKIGK